MAKPSNPLKAALFCSFAVCWELCLLHRTGSCNPTPNPQPPHSPNLIINPSASIICMFFLQSWTIICLCLLVCVWLGSYLKASGTENYPTAILSCINSYFINMYYVFLLLLSTVLFFYNFLQPFPLLSSLYYFPNFHHPSLSFPLSILISSILDIPCLASSPPLNLENHTADVTELRYCSVIGTVTIIQHLRLRVDNFAYFAFFSPVIYSVDPSQRNICCTFILAHIHFPQKTCRTWYCREGSSCNLSFKNTICTFPLKV